MEYPFLKSAEALDSFVARWRDGTLPGPEFTHAAHVAVCAWLTFDHSGGDLAAAMKDELIRFNAAVGTPNSPDRGYHETLTRFWCVLVEDAVSGQSTRFAAALYAVRIYGTDREASGRYYSFDVLKSRLARQQWIEPDLCPLPTKQTQPAPPSRRLEEA